MKQFFYFFMLCAFALATIGGFGYALWGGSWPIAIAIVLLAWMAWPQAKKYFQALTE